MKEEREEWWWEEEKEWWWEEDVRYSSDEEWRWVVKMKAVVALVLQCREGNRTTPVQVSPLRSLQRCPGDQYQDG